MHLNITIRNQPKLNPLIDNLILVAPIITTEQHAFPRVSMYFLISYYYSLNSAILMYKNLPALYLRTISRDTEKSIGNELCKPAIKNIREETKLT